jgi:hypothetical protein
MFILQWLHQPDTSFGRIVRLVFLSLNGIRLAFSIIAMGVRHRTSRRVKPSYLSANQRAVMQRYADNKGWRVTVIEDDSHRLVDNAAAGAFDLALCWRTSELRDAEFLLERFAAYGIELLAVAQSCSALPE